MDSENFIDKINKRKKPSLILIISLFLATVITCVIAGTQWAAQDPYQILNWGSGIEYAILILTFLSAHEFGHYFAAKYHKVDATLPYYIPFPFPTVNFGTFGAVIKTLSPIPSRKALFDIGIAGPLSGFVVATGFLIYGFITLPDIGFLHKIHPQLVLSSNGLSNTGLFFGDTLYYSLMSKFFANPSGFLPPLNEIYHYPFLNVGWFGLFVTTLNMLPMGQLDGGHIVYAMFGKYHSKIARVFWWILLSSGIISLFGLLFEYLKYDTSTTWIVFLKPYLLDHFIWINNQLPFLFKLWIGWLVWALVAKFIIKLDHPPVFDNTKIGLPRMILGYISFIVLILCFSYNGIYILENL